MRNLKPIPDRWEMIKLRTAEGSGPLRKKPIYKLFTYTHQGGKFEFEAVGIDQENFSVLERALSKELRSKYGHLKGLYVPDSADGRYVIHLLIGDPMFTKIGTGRSAKGEPIGDETLFGWAVHGEKGESDHSRTLPEQQVMSMKVCIS